MPKPNKNTPIDHITSLLDALPEWYTAHTSALADGLDDTRDLDAELGATHDALRDEEQRFAREQKEDQAATIAEDILLSDCRALLSSGSTFVQSALREHPEPARMRRQFFTNAPSDSRDAGPALKALDLLRGGLLQHADLFQTRAKLHARLVERAAQLIPALEDANKLRKREQRETRAASMTRDAARDAALSTITALDDAARLVHFDDPLPYQTLQTLYTIHCPEAPQDTEPPQPEADPTLAPSDPTP
jgi:hypothetical protein